MQAEAPQVATQPAWRPPRLRRGEKVVAYTSATTMLVDEPGSSSNVMVESSWPLVTEDAQGALAPTDMTLQPLVSGGWAPANSPVQDVIGQDLGAGVMLGAGAGTLAIHPGGAQSAAGVRSANKIFYANSDLDVDTIVEPMPNGVALNWTLRSPLASEQTSMTLDLPAGVTLLASGAAVNLVQGGRVVGTVSPPLAWDAQNTQVPVRYEVSGSTITVTTSHHGRDLAYPVSVDPVLWYDQGNGIALDPGLAQYVAPQTANWVYTALPGYESSFYGGFTGGRFFISAAAGLSAGNAVWMNRRLNAFATRVDFPDLRYNAAANVCVFAGLWDFNAVNAGSETSYSGTPNGPYGPYLFGNCTGLGPTYVTACASSSCDPTWGTPGNWSGVNLIVAGPVSGSGAIMSFTGAYLYWNDRNAPLLTTSGLPTGWTNNPKPTVWVNLHDDGLGIGTDTVNGDQRALAWGTIDNDPQWRTVPLLENKTVCDGTLNGQCWSDGNTNLAFQDPIPDGVRTVHITGRDILGHTTTTDQTVKVDTHGPVITTTGRLADLGRSTSGSEPPRSVSKTVHMTAVVSDANGSLATSGLSSYSLSVTQSGHATASVTTHAVLADGSWKIDYDFVPSSWNQGPVTFALNATDTAGNASVNTFTVNVARGDITTLIEGQKTAKRLVLQAEDLKPASPASTVVFQYRTKTTSWQNIPAANLQAMDGSSISTNSFAVSSSTHRSSQVVYNITDHLSTATQVYVRGYFSSATGDTTDDVLTGIDTSGLGTSDSMVDMGPGKVDELTGNFQLADTDVDIDSYKEQLGITRTYNSRQVSVAGAPQPFGPGWTLGMPVDDNASIYTKVIDYDVSSDPDTAFLGAAEVDTSDGNALPFEEHETDNGYYSLPEFDNLSLQRQVDSAGTTTSFTLKDRDSGQTLVFGKATGNLGEWALSSVQEASSAVATTFRYTPGPDNRLKLTDVVAPTPVDCSGANLSTTAGCRSLHLTWNGGYTRVTGIDFVAPGNGLTGNKVAVAAYTYYSDGRLSSAYDPRPGAALGTQYTYDANGRLSTVTPPGENAWTLSYTQGAGEPIGVGRLVSVARSQPVGTAGTPTTAKQVIFYNMAVRGSGAVYDMSANTLAGWSQVDDIPTDAAALFRPDHVPGNPPSTSDYATATFHYLDALGRLTNEVRPGGETTTTEHDAAGNVTRELSAVNRATALATGTTTAAHAARAQELSTIRTFGERTQGSGWRLLDEKGPLHSTQLPSGTTVQARKHTVNTYDDSDPDSKSLNLPIKTVESAYVPGTGDTDSRTKQMAYNSDGLLTSTAVDPAGLNLVTKTEYNSLGLVAYQEMPRSASQTAASTRRTIYYTAGTNPDDSACSNKPAWVNLPCKIASGGQPTTCSSSTLPVSVFEYDAYEQQTKKTDCVNGVSRRVQTDTYNGDRPTSRSITGTTGDARPDVTYGYSPTTGRLLTTTAQSSPTKTVTRVYNAAGQISSYTDADGGTTTTAYDMNGRPTSITDPSGTRSLTYDATTGRVTSITEPQLGAITTAFDADGALSSEVFPNANLKLTISRDETGTVTGRSYVKQAPCSTGCTTYSDSAARSAHDQWLTETGTDKTRTYAYDAAGRLTSSSDAPGGTACVTKTYTYDPDGNRLTRKTYPAGSGGACSTSATPTTQTLTYDEADRLTNSGYAYDTLGRITTVPAADAGGTNALTSSYYNDDRAHTLTQGGTTTTLDLDPADRVRQRTIGTATPTVSHYGDDSDEPVWTTQGSTTIRNGEDAAGDVVATVGPSGGGSSSWSGPTTSVLDNFNRADGSLGSNWSNLAGTTTGAIDSNQAKLNGSGYGYQWWNPNSYTGAGEVYMTVPTVSTTTNDQLYLDIVSGWSTSNLNGYELTLTRGPSNDTIQISKYTNGSESSLGSAQTMTGHLGAGDKLALTRETGGLLKVWRSAAGASTWTQIGTTVTNTTYFESGQSWQIAWGALGTDYRLDDFGGGQITATGPSGTKLEISDLHGDIVSEVPNTSGAAASLLSPIDVFGTPTTSAGANLGLGYLGAKQRNTTLTTGTIEMGARLYQPQIGRFLQPDPIYGGSLNAYDYALQDPANAFDLNGMCAFFKPSCAAKKARNIVRQAQKVTSNILNSPASADLKKMARVLAKFAERHPVVNLVAKSIREGTKVTAYGFLGCNILKSVFDKDNSFSDSFQDAFDCSPLTYLKNN